MRVRESGLGLAGTKHIALFSYELQHLRSKFQVTHMRVSDLLCSSTCTDVLLGDGCVYGR